METKKLAERFVQLIEKVGVLKNIPRMGWKMRGVPNCESVADHSYRVIIVAMVLGDILKEKYSLNMELLLRSAILHEIPESELTDLALGPALSVERDIKHKAESTAFKNIFQGFSFAEKYFQDWMDFEMVTGIEGKIVKLADKIDMMVQAYQYEKNGVRNLDDFWNNIENFETYEINLVKEIYDFLNAQHKKITKAGE